MNLMDDYQVTKKKPKKNLASKIILIAIIILTILLIGLIALRLTIKPVAKTKLELDGNINNDILQMLEIQEDGSTLIPIRDIAKSFGYNSFNGDYIEKSEDINKCYVESDNEIAIFSKDSNKIYKVKPNETEYEYYYIDDPVVSKNGKLYTTMDGISKAFNVDFSYNQEKNTYKIQTLDYLINAFNTQLVEIGYQGTSEEFDDKKSVLENVLIVQDEKSKYGLYDISKQKEILEVKYDEIEYIPNMEVFLTKSNNKYGIVSKTGTENIKRVYDDIELIDKDAKLFKVKKDNKFGIVNLSGKEITDITYDAIGIDNANFKNNDIKSKYILVGKVIPIMKDKLYGFVDTNGKIISECKYDSLGYIASTNKDAENLLVIPGYNVIVACKDKKYILVNSSGEELYDGNSFDEVYMKTEGNDKKYYLVLNGKTYDAEDQLSKITGANEENESTNNKENKDNDKDENKNEKQNPQEGQETQEGQENQSDEENNNENQDPQEQNQDEEEQNNDSNNEESGDEE